MSEPQDIQEKVIFVATMGKIVAALEKIVSSSTFLVCPSVPSFQLVGDSLCEGGIGFLGLCDMRRRSCWLPGLYQ